MALRFENINGVVAALGVEWYRIQEGTDEKVFSARLVKSTRANHKLTLRLNQHLCLGFGSSKGTEKAPRQVISALAWYAWMHRQQTAPQAIVWVLGDINKSNDLRTVRAWVGAVSGGMPVVRGDRMARLGDVSALLHDMLGDQAAATQVHVVGLNETSFGLFGDHHNEFLSMEETTIKVLFTGECPLSAHMMPLGLSRIAITTIAVSLAILAVAGGTKGYYSYTKEKERKAELAREAEQKRIANLPKPNVLYASAFANSFNAGEQKITAAEGAKATYNLLKGLQFFDKGWYLSAFTCTTKALPLLPSSPPVLTKAPVKPTCEVAYKRSAESGHSPIPADDYPLISGRVDQEIGRRPFAFHPALLDTRIKPEALFALFVRPLSAAPVLSQVRLAKDMNLNVNFTEPSVMQSTGGNTAPAISGTTFVIKRGTWSISGSFSLYEVLYTLPETAFVENIKVMTGADVGDTSFQADGFYFSAEEIAPQQQSQLQRPAPQYGQGQIK